MRPGNPPPAGRSPKSFPKGGARPQACAVGEGHRAPQASSERIEGTGQDGFSMLSTACPLEVLESRLCRWAEVAARRIRRPAPQRARRRPLPPQGVSPAPRPGSRETPRGGLPPPAKAADGRNEVGSSRAYARVVLPANFVTRRKKARLAQHLQGRSGVTKTLLHCYIVTNGRRWYFGQRTGIQIMVCRFQ